MRKRMLNPDFFTDSDLVRHLDFAGRLFYQGLWCVAEDSGVFDPDPWGLKMKIFPGDSLELEVVKGYYETLKELGKVIEFEVNGKVYAWIKNFHKHQKIDKPSPPSLPLPEWVRWHGQEEGLERHKWRYEVVDANCRRQVGDKSPTCPPEKKGKEEKRTEVKETDPDANASGQEPGGKSKKKRPKPVYDEDTKALVTELAEWRIEQNAPPTERDWHLKQLAIVQKLRDKGGYTPDQLRACLHDAQNDEYWRARLDSWAAIERYLPKWKLKQARADPANGSRNDDPYLDEIVKEARARRARKAAEANGNGEELTQQPCG